MKPFPQIPRWQGEPMLEGAPHSARDSIFLSTPGLGQAMEIIDETNSRNSRERHTYIGNLTANLNESKRRQIATALGEIGRNGLTESSKLMEQALSLHEKLKIEEDIPAPTFKDDFLNIMRETDSFTTHLDRFAEYIESPPKKRQNIISTHAGNLFTDPEELFSHTINSIIIGPRLEDSPEDEDYFKYNQELVLSLQDLARKPELATFNRDNLIGWMKTLVIESDYQSVVETLLKNWINVDDMALVVDRMHQLATAAYPYSNKEFERKMLEITSLTTDILPFDSRAACYYAGAQVIGSLKVRQQRLEIDDAEKVIGGFHPSMLMKVKRGHWKQLHSPAYKKYCLKFKNQIFQEAGTTNIRTIRKSRFKERAIGLKRMTPRKSIDALDDDALMTDSLLRGWINERMAASFKTKKLRRSTKISGKINLPGVNRLLKAPLNQVVGEAENVLAASSAEELGEAGHWQTLALIVPKTLTQKQIEDLSRANQEAVQKITDSRLRSISQRGDRIFITNELLKDMGFENLEIKPLDKEGYQLQLRIGGKTFTGQLNKNFKLMDKRYKSQLELPITGAFLEHVIGCHVNELLCGPVDDSGPEGEKAKKQFYSRRDCQRVLQLGEKPSDKQILIARFDYGIDLIKRNEERVAGGETRLVTWVKAVDRIDIAGIGPVESYLPNSTQNLDKILATKSK